jgi:hypothetical protein
MTCILIFKYYKTEQNKDENNFQCYQVKKHQQIWYLNSHILDR